MSFTTAITKYGKSLMAGRIGGLTSDYAYVVAVGYGTTAPTEYDTGLENLAGWDLAPLIALDTTDTADDTLKVQYAVALSADHAGIYEVGIFSYDGYLIARAVSDVPDLAALVEGAFLFPIAEGSF